RDGRIPRIRERVAFRGEDPIEKRTLSSERTVGPERTGGSVSEELHGGEEDVRSRSGVALVRPPRGSRVSASCGARSPAGRAAGRGGSFPQATPVTQGKKSWILIGAGEAVPGAWSAPRFACTRHPGPLPCTRAREPVPGSSSPAPRRP